MFLLVAVFTIVGDFIEPIPAIIIFVPVVNQLADQASINSVHMGIVLIITLAFGLITPPYGLSLLMASKFIRVRFSSTLRASLPIYVIFFATITFAIFFPKAVLWLPKMLFPELVGCFKAPDGGRYICPRPRLIELVQRRRVVDQNATCMPSRLRSPVADPKEIVDLRTYPRDARLKPLLAALPRTVIAGDLLKVVAEQTHVELFGREGGRAIVETSVEAVLISRRPIGEDVCLPTKNRFSRRQSPGK